jgi:hypothetical protein
VDRLTLLLIAIGIWLLLVFLLEAHKMRDEDDD